jgi:preprotein translocase subunit SecA
LQSLLENNEARLDQQMDSTLETLETFMQGLRLEEEGQQRSPSQLVAELSELLHLPVKLSNEEQKLFRSEPEKAADLIHDRVEEALRAQGVLRLIGALERRLETDVSLSADELAREEWKQIGEKLAQAVRDEFTQRRERLIGTNNEGQIARELSESLGNVESQVHDGHLLNALIAMPETRSTSFDKKSHRQIVQRKKRLSFAYYTASFLEKLEADEITEKVLAHLKNAQKAMQAIWGQGAWESMASGTLENVNEAGRALLKEALGTETYEGLNGRPLGELSAEAKKKAVEGLGKRGLTESYRQLLLRVISELWIDYLTKMEALRISIRLEAYAQRDPLVEYKAQAYKMFRNLFADMRSSLVNRMFVFQPGPIGQTARAAALPAAQPGDGAASEPTAKEETVPEGEGNASGGKKRRRRKKH